MRDLGGTGLVVSRLELGLAALGRPGYITLGHADDLRGDLNVSVMKSQAHAVLDAARSYGRRFSRHWSIPQIHDELLDSFAINVTGPGIAKYIRRHQTMLAARQQDPEALRRNYHGVDSIIQSIDGLQPEKGYETLYVVRELTGKRVWFAEALLSATADEVRRLIAQAKPWAEALGKPVALWISDKQDAFVTGIQAEFPRVPRHTGIVPITSSAIWPSPSSRPTVMSRFKCTRRYAA